MPTKETCMLPFGTKLVTRVPILMALLVWDVRWRWRTGARAAGVAAAAREGTAEVLGAGSRGAQTTACSSPASPRRRPGRT